VYCSFFVFPLLVSLSSPSLSLAIGKKISNQKVFFFFGLRCFFLIAQTQRIKKDVVTEKEEKHKPGKVPLSCLPGVCDYLFFTGRRLNHKRQQNH